jgi:nitroreductase
MLFLSVATLTIVVGDFHGDYPHVHIQLIPNSLSKAVSIASAEIFVEHASSSDLVIDLGVGDPTMPKWSQRIWDRKASLEDYLDLTVDLQEAAQYLPPSKDLRWFLEVFDASIGNVGQILGFNITYQGQTFISACVPVAIHDLQTSYSYIPGVTLELAISRRESIRAFQENTPIQSELLYEVLRAGYGFSSKERTVPNIGGDYPAVIYVRNYTGVYKYNPSSQSLDLWREGQYGWWGSPVELLLAIDLNKTTDYYLGFEEVGCIVQNIYLEANTLGLGTVCVGQAESWNINATLGLPPNEQVLFDMPLGYPGSSSLYNLTCVEPPGSSSLPQIQQGSVLLEYALENRESSHDFSEIALTPQEVSQILWSAYGYSFLEDLSTRTQHRTVPSAYASYPLKVYFANSSGIYEYEPSNHSISLRVDGDKRTEIRDATDQNWVASAPASLIIVWDSTKLGKTWAYTEAGCVIQNVNLESVAEGLIVDYANVVNESSMRDALGIGGSEQTNLHPVSVIVVGHPLLPDINNDGVVDILDAIMLSAAFLSTPNNPRWNPNADINHDGIVDIYDAIILAENFGKTT